MFKKKLVITGGAGYIGSILTEEALKLDFEVHIVDRFFFGTQNLDRKGAFLHKADTRTLNPEILRGAHAVFDLAAISNDPAGDLNPTITLDVNYRARRRLQELCIENGVQRYVLASSCSVYGFQDGIVNESSPVNPLTTYAEANLRAEAAAFSHGETDTSFTALRQATVYGLSPRMRFDLVVNAMALSMWKTGRLKILRDGEQWRPMIHVRDTARAFLMTLAKPKELVSGQIFNVGENSQNYRIIDLASMVTKALGKELDLEWYGDVDHRSYQVSFEKIANLLSFSPELGVAEAALEIVGALQSGITRDELKTRTLNWYQALVEWEDVLSESRVSLSSVL